MHLFLLLLFPIAVLVIGLAIGKGRITLKEFLIEMGAMVLLVVVGWFIARHQSVSDTEIWNGWLTKTEHYESWTEWYPCSHYSTDSKGRTRGPLHPGGHTTYHPEYWEATTSNKETAYVGRDYFDRATRLFGNRQYVHIARSNKVGGNGNKYVSVYQLNSGVMIPAAIEHSFTNYIKADPDTILRRIGQGEKFQGLLPDYPRTDANLSCNRVLTIGLSLPDHLLWNEELAKINARLGAKKWVNLTLVLVKTNDSSYVHHLEERWLGGKINDCVILVGCDAYPKIDWVRVMSWSRSEALKVELRDALMDQGSLEKRVEILKIIEEQVEKNFVHKPMEEFEYLMAGWAPSFGVLLFLYILGVGGSVGLTILFYKQDPFEARRFERW